MTGTAVIYVRMSKDRTGAGLGIARQEQECRELADKLGLEVVEVYSDNDISAYKSTRARTGYTRLLADIGAGKVQAVVCWHLDRLHRNTRDLETYLAVSESFPTFTVAGGSFDLTTPSGRATAKTVGAWAQAEVEQKALRQKAKNRQLAQAGERLGRGGPVPFGYDVDRVNPHPVYGPMVVAAYKKVLDSKDGSVLAGIAADWQKAGAPMLQSKSQRWDRSSVKRVLLRESNAGLVVLRGKVLPGVESKWKPLVEVSTFYAVKAKLTDPARRSSPGSAPRHLLSGIAVCDTCGSPLRRQKIGGKARTNSAVYACSNRRSVRGDCTQPVTIPLPVLEDWFVSKLLEERGTKPGVTLTTVDGEEAEAMGATLAELDQRIRSIALQLAEPDADHLSLMTALTEAKEERKSAEALPVATTRTDTLHLNMSWMYLGVREVVDESNSEDAETEMLLHRRNLIRAQLAEGGLRVLPVGRGRRVPVEERVSVQWAS